uniref:Uncharacterized protein n=1 Tax=Panagrolaimus sp. ES5 TaxID=591445 RepID=A0AC34GHT3_9BILA
MSSDEYVEIELDVDNKPQLNGVHVVGVSNNATKYEYDRGSYEVVEATSYKREESRTTPILNEKSLCLVCDGPANGIHFKALSCAACNAFFRRSVAENRKYICREEGKCEINYKARCLCRACRLKKCLIIGMDPASVQPQRDAIGSKKKGEFVERNGRKSSSVCRNAEIVTAEPVTLIKRKRKASTPPSEEPVVDEGEGEEEALSEQLYENPGSVLYQYSDDTTPRQSTTKEYEDGTVVIQWGSVGNLIEEVLCSYQQLQERRRLFYCPRTLRDLLGGTVPTFKKIEGYFEKDKLNIESAIIVEFVRSIQPFAMLDLETQVCLVRAFCLPMTIIEKHYMTYKQGGHLTNRIYHQNYCYIDLDETEKLMTTESSENNNSDIDTRHINCKTMFSINIPYMKKAMNDIVLPMSSVEMTDVEIVGLMLIMLFDPFAPNLNETAKKVVKAVRDRVYEDWFAVYSHSGISNGPEKIGNVVLITSAIQEFAQLIPQNFHMIRVFGITDYDEILNDVFLK